jgi:hypothetical protein
MRREGRLWHLDCEKLERDIERSVPACRRKFRRAVVSFERLLNGGKSSSDFSNIFVINLSSSKSSQAKPCERARQKTGFRHRFHTSIT